MRDRRGLTPNPSPSSGEGGSREGRKVLAAAIRREEWDRVAALLLLAMTDVVREMPRGDIDDVLALLSSEDDVGRVLSTDVTDESDD